MAARILNSHPSFVREFAEIHFPCVRREPQHVDVGPGAKNAVLRARKNHRPNLGMLKADALQRVVKLDVHAQVIGIQFKFVARADPAVFRHIHGQRRHGSIERKLPVLVARRIALIINRNLFRLHLLSYRYVHGPSYCKFACNAVFSFAKLSSTEVSEVSTTMSAFRYSGSRAPRILLRSSIAWLFAAMGRKSPWAITRDMCSSGCVLIHIV